MSSGPYLVVLIQQPHAIGCEQDDQHKVNPVRQEGTAAHPWTHVQLSLSWGWLRGTCTTGQLHLPLCCTMAVLVSSWQSQGLAGGSASKSCSGPCTRL